MQVQKPMQQSKCCEQSKSLVHPITAIVKTIGPKISKTYGIKQCFFAVLNLLRSTLRKKLAIQRAIKRIKLKEKKTNVFQLHWPCLTHLLLNFLALSATVLVKLGCRLIEKAEVDLFSQKTDEYSSTARAKARWPKKKGRN